jgi:hypothetical protein
VRDCIMPIGAEECDTWGTYAETCVTRSSR